MAWSASNIPNLSGRVAVVTGANSGLGLESCRELARAGAHVVMAARNASKAATAESDICASVANASIEVRSLDLASLASVQAFAEGLMAEHKRIDILINNAGVMAIPEQQTVDGFEMQFGVNHLGHFALTAHVLPAVLRADAARVVSVSSTMRHLGRAVDPDNPHLHGKYGPWKAYGQSKLANLHFAVGLHQRFVSSRANARSFVAHPGFSNTNLQAATVAASPDALTARMAHAATSVLAMSPARGALSQLRAATDPDALGGELYAPRFVNNGPPVRRPLFGRSHSRRSIDELWGVSERETGLELDVAAAMKARDQN